MADYNRSASRLPETVIWTKLRVPGELDDAQLAGYFQPLIEAPGHCRSSWGTIRGEPQVALLATLWSTRAGMKHFQDSASAQLLWEFLAAENIIILGIHETLYPLGSKWFGPVHSILEHSYVQMFWVYFKTPITDAQRTQISKLPGIRPAALGFSVPIHHRMQKHLPVQAWVIQPQNTFIDGNSTELMLWPHFWRDEEKSQFRNNLVEMLYGPIIIGRWTRMEEFSAKLQEVESLKEWKEEFYYFTRINRV